MKNTLLIKTLDDGRIQTDFIFANGITMMEIHNHRHDSKVLSSILERKYYQSFKGEWLITFLDEPYSISKPTFEKLIESAQVHIFARDNSNNYDGFC